MATETDTGSGRERLSRWLRGLFDRRIRIGQRISPRQRREVIAELDDSAGLSQDYVMLVMLSCIICTFGLILSSAAVIIGAMLIAPLMFPIFGMSMGLVRGEPRQLLYSLATLLAGIILAVLVSMLLGLAVSTSQFNFLEELPDEVVSRTSPTLFDLTIAFAGGLAASYALAQPRLSPTLPGVAIATALLPPLCVMGIGIAEGRPEVRDGALLLFLANFVAIIFSSAVVFALVGFGPLVFRRRREVMERTFILASVMLVLVAIPLVNFMIGIAGDARENQVIRSTLTDGLESISPDASLVSFEKGQEGGELHIIATVRVPRDLLYAEGIGLQLDLAENLSQTVALELLVIPVTRLDPLVPPTETPEPASDAGSTAAPVP